MKNFGCCNGKYDWNLEYANPCLTAFVDSATEFITQPIRTIQNTLVQDKTSSNSVNKLCYNCQNRSQKH